MAKKNRRPNTFDRMINECGGIEHIEEIRADKLQKYAPSLIRDIAYGNIRFDEQGQLFLNEMILSAIDTVANTKLSYHTAVKCAMDYYIMQSEFNMLSPQDQQMTRIAWQKTSDVFNILNTVIWAIKYTQTHLNDPDATVHLYNVPTMVANYRGSIADI